jgi:hypothetical protein
MSSPDVSSAEHQLNMKECGADNPPAVTIITAAFNSAPFLEQTLTSVLAQTFSDFELLLIDDGSTDETPAIAETFARTDRRIKVIRQKNGGTAAARNTALAGARGALFAILDSDDVWFPTYLAEQVAVLTNHPEIDVLAANALNLGGAFDGQPLLAYSGQPTLKHVSLKTLVRAEDSMSIMAMFRREVAERLAGFDANLRRSEDYDFWLRAADAGFRIVVNTKPLGLYRRRPDSLSADELRMLQGVITVLRKLQPHCATRPELASAIDQKLVALTQRAMLANARAALLQHDREGLALHIGALAVATGAVRYRVAKWLSDHAPTTIWWAYRCKRALGSFSKKRSRHDDVIWTSQHAAHRADVQG